MALMHTRAYVVWGDGYEHAHNTQLMPALLVATVVTVVNIVVSYYLSHITLINGRYFNYLEFALFSTATVIRQFQ